MTRDQRVDILKENNNIISDLNVNPKVVGFNGYADDFDVRSISMDTENFHYDKNRIVFEDLDTISAAIKYKSSDFLVFASEKSYGGGVWTGAKAQEEDIFLQTNLSELKNSVQKKFYPLNGILTIDCHIIRDKNFNVLNEPIKSRAYFAAAPNLNKEHFYPDLFTRMCTLTDASFDYHNGKNLIIGAWGCGVFKNDPKDVAKYFRELMPLFQYDYDNIVVAIPDKEKMSVFKSQFGK